MVRLNLLRHLLSDSKSLSQYQNGESVPFDDIKRRILLLERKQDSSIPDHFLRLAAKRDLHNIDSLESLLVNGLTNLGETYFQLKKEIIVIKKDKLEEWQELITFIPPLIQKAAYLIKYKKLPALDNIEALRKYSIEYILPNCRYTAIPSPELAELQGFIMEKKGLHDLHTHLNGSTETDIVWQDTLSYPSKIYQQFREGYKEFLVREQIEQESELMNPYSFYNLLKIARRLRYKLYDYIYPNGSVFPESDVKTSIYKVVFIDRFKSDVFQEHPWIHITRTNKPGENPMTAEGLMYASVLTELSIKKNPALAALFHFYLLILGLTNRLLVQQVHQFGFEQFQKHTLNRLRELSETDYKKRFFQMHGNDLYFLNFLEARFSPKLTSQDNVAFITGINKGWDFFTAKLGEAQKPKPTLKLVAHFIKRDDQKPDTLIRHKKLRLDTWSRAKALAVLLKNYPKYKSLITGIDAASSEFYAPPEVFAPAYRMFRRKNTDIKFTYHAGEDFFHVLSGLRAVAEAINFTEMKAGDRIGHATACGIDINFWKNKTGENILIKKGEWVDNMIFAYHYLVSNDKKNNSLLKFLENEIYKYFKDIYQFSTTPDISQLIEAWRFRKYCPMLLLSSSLQEGERYTVFDWDEWKDPRITPISPIVKELIKQYQNLENRKKYDEIISVSLVDDIDISEIIQKCVLAEMCKKEIAIEALPTSNLRIGIYKNIKKYHLWNWKKWGDSKTFQVPKIVIGTDDTGIFATNIFNEYASLFYFLEQGSTKGDALTTIKEWNKNSKDCRFE
jgi:adenosine deaminase